MSDDPFVFQRSKFVSVTYLSCYRNEGDVYDFVVKTRKSPVRTYVNELIVASPDDELRLKNFEMINVGFGNSLIRFLGPDNKVLRHVGDPGKVTLIVRSYPTPDDASSPTGVGSYTGLEIFNDHQGTE